MSRTSSSCSLRLTHKHSSRSLTSLSSVQERDSKTKRQQGGATPTLVQTTSTTRTGASVVVDDEQLSVEKMAARKAAMERRQRLVRAWAGEVLPFPTAMNGHVLSR